MIEIRRALPDEADALAEIALAAKRHWGYPERWIEIWRPMLTITPDFVAEADVWVIIIDGEQAGFCALIYSGERAALEHFWVLPGFMGQGVGGQLFGHALSRCREKGCTVLENESDPKAQGFYEKMGARKVGEHVGEIDGRPRILPVMEKPL
jgi:GNAT superfamily N-acetyltransferase